jgi:hypothetical protein
MLACCFLMVACLAYSTTPQMEAVNFPQNLSGLLQDYMTLQFSQQYLPYEELSVNINFHLGWIIFITTLNEDLHAFLCTSGAESVEYQSKMF